MAIFYAGKKIYAKNLLEETAEAMNLGIEWMDETPRRKQVALLEERNGLLVPESRVRKATKVGRTTGRS